jgi:hypothetical protein
VVLIARDECGSLTLNTSNTTQPRELWQSYSPPETQHHIQNN